MPSDGECGGGPGRNSNLQPDRYERPLKNGNGRKSTDCGTNRAGLLASRSSETVRKRCGASQNGSDPPGKRKAAPSLGTGRGKPLGEGLKSSKATVSISGAALQARLRYLASRLHALGLGTLNVRDYIASYASPAFEDAGFADAAIKTHGPEGRYGGILYIEKEGFMPLLERARLAEKYDVAIMSCKGMSVTAARTLIDKTCARYHIPLLILHDFDVSGFSIAKTLVTDTRRFSFKSKFRTVDLGLRLTDVQELGLESEPVSFGSVSPYKIRERLKTNGATADEIAFLMEGQRVELNAMTSDQFVAFVERKLTEAGIAQIVPPKDQLDEAYRLFARSKLVEEAVEEFIKEMPAGTIAVPDDLNAQVRDFLDENPESPWEEAVRYVVCEP